MPGDITHSAPLVSVVIVSYHTGESLWVAIDSVLSQNVPLELIVVDNGNAVETVQLLQRLSEKDSRLTLLTGQGNIGFARACNLGAQQAHAPYLLLMNPDCILPPRGLRTMVDAFQNYPNAGLAGPKLVDPSGRMQRGSYRSLLTPRNAAVEALFLHRLLPSRYGHHRLNRHEDLQKGETHAVPAISGAFMFMEKARYNALGGMDERYFLHVEDLDFCLRMAKTGAVTIFVPTVEVVHIQGTSEAPSYRIEWHKARGFMRYFHRHFADMPYAPLLLPLLSFAAMTRFALRSVRGTAQRFWTGGVLLKSDTRKILLLHRYLRQSAEERPLAGRTVLVTGALSQVGLCIVGRLIAGGAWVLALSRDKSLPVNHSRLRYINGNLKHLALPEDARADTVIHVAPLWLLPSAIQNFSSIGVKRVIAFGSTSALTKKDSSNMRERDLAQRLKEAERLTQEKAKAFAIELTLLRPTMIYGVGLDRNISRIANVIRRFRFIMLYPPASGLRRPVHADDLAAAAVSLIHHPVSHAKTYTLSGGEVLSYRIMIERIFIALGKRPVIVSNRFLANWLDIARRFGLGPGGDMARRMNQDMAFDHEAASHDFNYRPRGFLSGGIADL